MSSRATACSSHTTTPITLDFGHDFSGVNSMMSETTNWTCSFSLGTPKEILDEYTKLTGKSPLPPLWSFGLWMSRCTYNAEQQVRDIAGKLRENKIPCDVLHLDTGWFETDWQCDYEFSKTRFTDPKKMLADLKADGFRISCWQLPYFVPKKQIVPRTRLAKSRRPRCQGQFALRRRRAGFFQSQSRRVVSRQARQPV